MRPAIFKTGKGTVILPRSVAIEEPWQVALRRLRSATEVCVDLETSGLDWRHHHIVGWVLTFSGDPRDSYYLPVRHAPGGNILDWPGPQTATGWDGSLHPIEEEIIALLDRPGMYVFGHNFGFDLKFMWRLGMQAHDAWFECTQNNAALLDENGSFSLEMCCYGAGVQAKLSTEIRDHIQAVLPGIKPGKEMEHYWRLHGQDEVANEYGAGDGTSTWQLRDWQWEKLSEEELNRVHDIENRLLPILVRMCCHGVRVNEERVRELVDFTSSGQLERELGFVDGFNAKAPSQVEAWLREQGVDNFVYNGKTPRPTLNEEWLSTSEHGQKIITLRKNRTLRDSFLLPMLDRHIWNGRVHPNYHQMKGEEYGTDTGRLSCSDPNLQQASKRNRKIGRMHRSCFIPDEGRMWGSADFAQCEPVLLAVYSRARVLLDGFAANPPKDAHSAVTKAIDRRWMHMSDEEFEALEIAKSPEFKAARETGKRVNQTLLTGGGKKVLTRKYGIPPDEVERVWTEYFRALPEIKRLQRQSTGRMLRNKFVRSLLGRKARLESSNKAYVALNRLLQCGNADIIKLKMVQIDEYLKSEGRPVDMLNNVHDSLDFQFPADPEDTGRWGEGWGHYYKCLEIMQDFGEDQPIRLDVKLRVDHNEGMTWADATFGEEMQ